MREWRIRRALGYDDLPACSRSSPATRSTTRALSTLDVLWVLYDRVLRLDPRDHRRSGARPLPALQGPRPGRVLRGARGQGLHRRRALAGFGTFDSPLGPPPRSRCSFPASKSRAARSATACHRRGPRPRARPARGGDARVVSCRRRRARRGQQLRGDRSSPAASGSARCTAIVVDNRSSTYRWPGGDRERFDARGLERGARRRPRPRRDRARAGGAPAARPHAVIAEVERRMTTMRKRFYERATRARSTRIRAPRRARRDRGASERARATPSASSTSASASS